MSTPVTTTTPASQWAQEIATALGLAKNPTAVRSLEEWAGQIIDYARLDQAGVCHRSVAVARDLEDAKGLLGVILRIHLERTTPPIAPVLPEALLKPKKRGLTSGHLKGKRSPNRARA